LGERGRAPFSLDCALAPAATNRRRRETAPLARRRTSLKPAAVSLFCKIAQNTEGERLGGTLALLKPAGIPYFGAGADLDEAEKTVLFCQEQSPHRCITL
jgi:hypothetical protein